MEPPVKIPTRFYPSPPSSEAYSIDESSTEKTNSLEPGVASTVKGSSENPEPTWNDLENYPSVVKPIELLFEALKRRRSYDLAAIIALSIVVSSSLASMLHSLEGLPRSIRHNDKFMKAQQRVIFTDAIFYGRVKEIEKECEILPEISDVLDDLSDLLEETVETLVLMFDVAQKIIAQKEKPLPPLPLEESAAKPTVPDAIEVPSPATIASTLPCSETPQQCLSGLPPVEESRTELTPSAAHILSKKLKRQSADLRSIKPIPTTSPLERKAGRSKKIKFRHFMYSLKSKSSISLLSKGSSHNPDSVTLASCPSSLTLNSTTSRPMARQRLPDQPYELRYSDAFPVVIDGLIRDDIHMPMPSGKVLDVNLDSKGAIKAVSTVALMRMLTSRDCVQREHFMNTFFLTFRYFMAPSEVARHLISRLTEASPDDLDENQLSVWQTQARITGFRVNAIVARWLDMYWDVALDSEAIPLLRSLVNDYLAATRTISASDLIRIDAKLDNATRGVGSRRAWLTSHRGSTTPDDSATDPQLGRELPLKELRLLTGTEEIARQLTLMVYDLLAEIDAEQLVRWRFYGLKGNKGKAAQNAVKASWDRYFCFVQSLGLLVTTSIMTENCQTARCHMIELWLEVAIVRLSTFVRLFENNLFV